MVVHEAGAEGGSGKMRIKDANILRKRLAEHLEWIRGNGGGKSALAQCIEVIVNAIDDLPEEKVVPFDEYEALLRRFRHLMSNEYIASFDAVDRSGKYKRDITDAGKIPGVKRERWLHVGRNADRNFFRCSGCACVVFTKEEKPEFPQCPECFALMDGGVEND